jgi:3-hydroxyacyl-CoA dehydrogenase/enoyl-CoA hydratase/3-hydroxybutyryl-CoA epimerase/enoyl-CoA isomerase
MFQGETIRLQLIEAGVVELCFDRRDGSINKLDVTTVEELGAATEELYRSEGLRGVLVTSVKSGFIVGADIFEFTQLFARPEDEIAAHIAGQNAVFRRFEDLGVPIVTAINGVALGGGLEMALASDCRVAAETAQVGLPEVKLGLFPGFGGTVRLPRLTSAAVAIEWICSGKSHSAAQAAAEGVVDEVTTPGQLRSAALARLEALIASGDWRASRVRRHGPFPPDPGAFGEARARLEKDSPLQPAALEAVKLMESCAALGRDPALDREHRAFARIARTQAAASLVQLFVSEQRVKGKAKSYGKQATSVRRVGVVGAGIMGGGIAYTCASRGFPAVMKDIAAKALEQGMAEARKLLEKQVRAGRLAADQMEAALSTIHPQLDYADFGSLDLVIEAVVENMEVKKRVLSEIEQRTGGSAVIASNTSSLSIESMAAGLARPENFLGLHFFNPVPVMPLVEVVRGSRTSAIALASAVGYAAALGKTPIVVRDCPGFLVNRILTAYLLGGFRAMREGADFRVMDQVMESFGWPMGPAYLQDVIGLDTLLRVVEVISAGYPRRMAFDFPIAPGLLLESGRLGQKGGTGYYRYEADPKGKPKKLPDAEACALLASLQAPGARPLEAQEIIDRLMLPMIIEASLCLEQGVADSPEEIDLALVLGLGFPRYAGGPLKYADWLGLKRVLERCDAYASLGSLYAPTERMRSMARAGERYFS